MRRLALISLAVLTSFYFAFSVNAETIELTPGGGKAVMSFHGNPRDFTGEIRIGQIRISEGLTVDNRTYSRLTLETGSGTQLPGCTSEPGEAMLPTMSCFFAIPIDGEIDISIASAKTVKIENVRVIPFDADGSVSGVIPDTYSIRDSYYPQERFKTQELGVLRNFRLCGVTFYPVSYNPAQESVEVVSEMAFNVNISGGDLLIPEMKGTRTVSEAFYPFFRTYISNPGLLDNVEPIRGKYWIITHDLFYDDVMASDLVAWKSRKGFEVVVTPLSDISPNPSYFLIKQHITARYLAWEPKPDYILLVGDYRMDGNNNFPTYHYVQPSPDPGDGASDNYYTFIDNDYFPDMLIGRFPVDNVNEFNYLAYKTLSYEKDPYMDNTDWYLKGAVAAGQDPWGWVNFVSSRTTVMLSREIMMENGFTEVDTQFTEGYEPVPPTVIVNAINEGVSYVNYRGWGRAEGWTNPAFEISTMYQCENGRMMPFMTATVCAVGDFEEDECLGEHWLLDGSIAQPKGGAVFTGNANHFGHTRWTNALNAGLYDGLFNRGMNTPARALLAGKFNIYYAFPGDAYPGGQVQFYFNTYNILGDPELNLFTAIPRSFDVDEPSSIAAGINFLHLDVMESGVPVDSALISVSKDGEVLDNVYSDAGGNADIPLDNLTPGTLKVTILKHNFAPKYFDIPVVDQPEAVAYFSHVIDDDANGGSQGNGDGIINPGETVEITVTLKNYGSSQTANDVNLEAAALSENIIVESGRVSYGSINPGATSSGSGVLIVSVADDCPHAQPFLLRLDITSRVDNYESSLRDEVASYNIVIYDKEIDDFDGNGDGVLDPGEKCYIHLGVTNDGTVSATDIISTIQSPDPDITIVDDRIEIGDLAPGDSIDRTGQGFLIQAGDNLYPGRLINCPLNFSASGGIIQNTSMGLLGGTIHSYDPIGPDNYGYYCFDDTDVHYTQRPVFEWIELEDSWDELRMQDDVIVLLELPFTFRYYGRDYDTISVCDNGYIAFGNEWWANFYNAQIPGPQNVHAQVSPLWNDFKYFFYPAYISVRYHYDSDRDIFIIGWNNARLSENQQAQTFEIILYNPESYPTATGDGIIVFQYDQLRSFTSSSVGITSPDKTDGLQYFFEGIHSPGAAELEVGRAIKFTTEEGMTPVQDPTEIPLKNTLHSNYPNPFNSGTTISFETARRGRVKIDVFDLLGRKVAALLDKYMPAGRHSIKWDASGRASGIYFIRMTAGDFTKVKKAVMIK